MREISNPLAADLDHVLEHTRECWEEMRGEQLFLTGGTGFFGRWLLESMLWANRRLSLKVKATILTRDPNRFSAGAPHLATNEAVTLLRGDVVNFKFPEGSFRYVFHSATETNPGRPAVNPLDLFTANVEGTRRTLEFATACGAGSFLFTSSGAVYGRQPATIQQVPEDFTGAPDPTDLDSAYGQSKRASEFLCTAYSSQFGLNAKIARGFAFVGPGLPLDANYAIGNFIRDALQGGPIQIQGDGTPFRSYLYAADLAIWLWVIFFRGSTGRVYNVGSDQDITLRQLAAKVASVVAPGASVVVAKPAVEGQPAQRYVPSILRARRELGLDVWIGLQESIRRTADFHRRHA